MTNIQKHCGFCGIEFFTYPNKQSMGRKYCSRDCSDNASRGKKHTWGDKISKSKMGHGWPVGYRERQSEAQKKRFKREPVWNKELKYGNSRDYWKDKNWYTALHKWINRHKGIPKKCEHCGSEDKKRYYWANKSHEYKRELDDWIRLCGSCHIKYDKIYESARKSLMKRKQDAQKVF